MSEFPSVQVSVLAPKPVVRKKFAVPPVKVACLECRASRTRCDGQANCTNCVTKGKTCVYAQSRRGGSRIRRRKLSTDLGNGDGAGGSNGSAAQALPLVPERPDNGFLSAPITMVAPGAGLKELDISFDDTEYIFDSIFGNQVQRHDSGYGSSDLGTSAEPEEIKGPVRVYMSDEDVLCAYYVYIHPYFPILPPPSSHLQVTDRAVLGLRPTSSSIFTTPLSTFEPSSPISLAMSSVLALIPHPSDPDPSSSESTLMRRDQAQAFASASIQAFELESELLESTFDPKEALSAEVAPIARERFHPDAPLENEGVLALLMLCTYEYGQRGNIAKMRNRAGQALVKAMELNLHSRGAAGGSDAEANRRAWWMTYVCVVQGAIFSSTPCPILLYDPRFTTASPTFAADPESWSDFIHAQQVIVTATQFVIDLDVVIKTKSNTSAIWDRMIQLDNIIEPLMTKADVWIMSSTPPTMLDWSELTVAHALRGIARIKLNSARIKVHRYCAFSDMPVFTKKHCDLAAMTADSVKTSQSPSCGCSTTYHSTLQNLIDSSNESVPQTTTASPGPIGCDLLPFSSMFSSKVCLRAAFNIARSFQMLPFPPASAAAFMPRSSSSAYDSSGIDASLNPAVNPPRMVPMFTCCAMQGSYAMVMLSFKSREIGFVNNGGPVAGDANSSIQGPVKQLLARLEDGLEMILGAVRNYAIAYEALGGMRDQIEIAARTVGGANANIVINEHGQVAG